MQENDIRDAAHAAIKELNLTYEAGRTAKPLTLHRATVLWFARMPFQVADAVVHMSYDRKVKFHKDARKFVRKHAGME